MYLSYSGFKTYDECARSYYHNYVAKTPLPKPDNRVHMLYGDAVGKIFETFYAERMWRRPKTLIEDLQKLVHPTIQRVITGEIRKGGVFDFSEKNLKPGTRSIKEIDAEVRSTIPRGVQIIKQHRLLGVGAQAELKLDVEVEGHKIGGRADFVMRRIEPLGDLVIIDGKGSRHRDKYTNHRQLRWYAMQHQLKHGVAPDRTGFLYWRQPPETALDWVTTDLDALKDLKRAVLLRIAEIEEATAQPDPMKAFPAMPSGNCHLCSYKEICPEGVKFLDKDKVALARMKAERELGVDEETVFLE